MFPVNVIRTVRIIQRKDYETYSLTSGTNNIARVLFTENLVAISGLNGILLFVSSFVYDITIRMDRREKLNFMTC